MTPDDGKDPPARTAPANTALTASALAALHKGQVIEAIKQLRMERGLGLKEAKGEVDAYLATQPMLQRKLAASQAEAKRSFIVWLLVVTAIAAGGYFIFFTR